MAAARAVFLIVLAVGALGLGAFIGGAIAQPALMGLVPWHESPQAQT
jgi:hypothetical protein